MRLYGTNYRRERNLNVFMYITTTEDLLKILVESIENFSDAEVVVSVENELENGDNVYHLFANNENGDYRNVRTYFGERDKLILGIYGRDIVY